MSPATAANPSAAISIAAYNKACSGHTRKQELVMWHGSASASGQQPFSNQQSRRPCQLPADRWTKGSSPVQSGSSLRWGCSSEMSGCNLG